jgi:hypothetical protein
MQQRNALDPAAPPFTPIYLSGFRRAHPPGPDGDGLEVEWVDNPTPDVIEQAVIESLARVAAYAEHPDVPVGEAGSVHLVYVYGLRATPYGKWSGIDVIRMPLCVHGLMPPLTVVCPCCDEETTFQYVDPMGAYYPVTA